MSLKNLIQSKTFILAAISFVLFLIPFLLWGNVYLVGGDDTRLYYVFPNEFLSNYAFNIVSDNTLGGAMTGYASVSYFAPIFFVIALFKMIPVVSTQMLLYGLNLALGFLGLYKLIGLWMESKSTKGFYSNIIASLFYVSSVYLVHTLYTHQLLSMYLVSIVPFTLYFFIRAIREDSLRFIAASILIFSVFSSTINTLPWSAAVFIAVLPFIFYEALISKKQFFKHAIIFVVFSILLNLHWIFHIVYQYIHPTGLQTMIEYYSSADFVNDNIRIITAVSQAYTPLNIPFAQMDNNFLINFSWTTIIQIVFFAIITLAAAFITKAKKVYAQPYLVSLIAFLLAWFLFSPNFGSWGRDVFLYFSLHVPFFTMFRNMYDKFALPLSLTYALVLAMSLHMLIQHVKNKVFIALCVSLLIVISFNLFTSAQYFKKNISESTKFSGTFNDDFSNLVTYLKQQHDPSHVLWIPLNDPTYANIEDKYLPNHYYSGLSPLRTLADTSDYTGRFSFITQSDLFLGDKIFDLLQKKKYNDIGEILQQRNTKYIIVDHQQLPSSMKPFMYGGESQKILTVQGSEFQKTLLGQKIKDFGKRYSLYAIHPRFGNDKIYLTDNVKKFPQGFDQLQYKKIASYQYDITINNLSDEKKLVFLDPYSKDWVISLKSNNNEINYAQGENVLVYDYANGWSISPERIKKQFGEEFYRINPDGTMKLQMSLYFQPQKYSVPIYIISFGAFIILCVIVIFNIRWKRNEK